MSKKHRTTKKPHISFIFLALALVTIIAFEPVRHNDFVSYDDDIYVTDNPNVNKGISAESVRWAFTATRASNWHPLTWLSHTIDCQLFGLNPFWHHLVNLLLHIANTLLLLWILIKITDAPWRSAFVAGLFALHPLHVESVAWVAERKDVLSSLFWMLTIAAYIQYVKQPGTRKFLLVFLAFGLGLMAKPMLVTLPFVLLLLDYWPLCRLQKPTAYRLIREKIPLFILSTGSCIVTYLVQKSTGATMMVENLHLSTRINNALVSYAGYITKMIYPRNLVVLYPHKGTALPIWQPILSVVVLIVITAGIIYLLKRGRRYLAVGWFWYLGTLVPVIGLIHVGRQAMADRYTYLPSIGLFIIAAWGVPELLTKYRYRKMVISISALVALTALSICTRIQLRHWRNNFTLYQHALAVTENNPVMHNNLGNAFRADGNHNEAFRHYSEALQIKPDFAEANRNIANEFYLQGKLQEATKHLRQALRIEPNHIKARYNLGLTLSRQNRFTEAITHYNHALELNPDYPEALNGLAWILCTHPQANERNPTRAITLAKRAAELTEHKNADILDTLATSYAATGQFDMAIETAESALKLASNEQNDRLISHLHNQLDLYRQGKTTAEPSP